VHLSTSSGFSWTTLLIGIVIGMIIMTWLRKLSSDEGQSPLAAGRITLSLVAAVFETQALGRVRP
jgi:hypothetical protein